MVENVSGPGRLFQGCGCLFYLASGKLQFGPGLQLQRQYLRIFYLPRAERPRGGGSPSGAQRPGRLRADECGRELSAGACAHGGAHALCLPECRREGPQRGPRQRLPEVLHPRAQNGSGRPGIGAGEGCGQRRGADDRHGVRHQCDSGNERLHRQRRDQPLVCGGLQSGGAAAV